MAKFAKQLEKQLKSILNSIVRSILTTKKIDPLPLYSVKKVLVFRLDQRIGNGILLQPLLRAIKKSCPNAQVELLIHHPVADLLSALSQIWIDRIWAYNQSYLLKNSFRYLQLIQKLRREKYDVVITSNNPDNFSFSQAMVGKLINGKAFVGFDAKQGEDYFNIAVKSSTQIHYADAMVDLWRVFDASAKCEFGGITAPILLTEKAVDILPALKSKPILIWIGATGNKILPPEVFSYIYEQTQKISTHEVIFACGPADLNHLENYPSWLKERVTVWQQPLPITAGFFSECCAFISGDTGPMHLAVSLGVKTLTIFIDSNMTQYGYAVSPNHFSIQWTEKAECKMNINNALKEILYS